MAYKGRLSNRKWMAFNHSLEFSILSLWWVQNFLLSSVGTGVGGKRRGREEKRESVLGLHCQAQSLLLRLSWETGLPVSRLSGVLTDLHWGWPALPPPLPSAVLPASFPLTWQLLPHGCSSIQGLSGLVCPKLSALISLSEKFKSGQNHVTRDAIPSFDVFPNRHILLCCQSSSA